MLKGTKKKATPTNHGLGLGDKRYEEGAEPYRFGKEVWPVHAFQYSFACHTKVLQRTMQPFAQAYTDGAGWIFLYFDYCTKNNPGKRDISFLLSSVETLPLGRQ